MSLGRLSAKGDLALGLSVGVMVLFEVAQSSIIDDGASFFLPLITLVGSFLFFAGKRMARPVVERPENHKESS